MKKFNFMVFDIVVFSILAIICEFLSVVMFEKLNSSFYISLSIMISIICIIRWGVYGSIPAILSGVMSFVLNQQGFLTDQPMIWYEGIFYYIVGNAFLTLPLFYYNKDRSRKIETMGRFFIFVICCFVSLAVGKGLFIFIINHAYDGTLAYFSSIGLSMVISIIILLLLKDRTELLLDMKEYIKEQNMEDEYERQQSL